MDAKTLDEFAHALRDGKITKDKFVRETAHRWRRIARDLYQRWRRKLPAWVEPEDVEQELVIKVVEHVETWLPDKGTRIGAYVTWSAVHRTQRAMNKWRGARIHGNEGKNPGRQEFTFTTLISRRRTDEGDERFDPCDLAPTEADQERRALVSEAVEAQLARAEEVRGAAVVRALLECDYCPEEAAKAIWEDYRVRVECRLLDEDHALRMVRAKVAEMIDAFVDAA